MGRFHMNGLEFIISVALAGAILLTGSASWAAGVDAGNGIDETQILALHNKSRAEVGVPPLRWSDKLAEGAEKWAKLMAALEKMQHSHTSGVGENLAFSSAKHPTLDGMVAFWIKEKDLFSLGYFRRSPAMEIGSPFRTIRRWYGEPRPTLAVVKSTTGRRTFWFAGTARKAIITARRHTETGSIATKFLNVTDSRRFASFRLT